MSVRRWQPSAIVVDAAVHAQGPIYDDLARAMPVSAVTLSALVASGDENAATDWAASVLSKVIDADTSHITEVLVSSGFDETGCTPDAYGILDPSFDGERIVAVARPWMAPEGQDPSAQEFDRREPVWERITASGWDLCKEPIGMPYVQLRGDVLADAIETITAGASLILQPTQPTAWLSTKDALTLTAAAQVVAPTDSTGVYAIVDPLNTSAVLTLFHVVPGPNGPVISVRKAGAWVPDDGTMHAQLTGINPPPVVTVSPEQVPDVLRQADDFDSTHPQTARGPTGGATQNANVPPGSAPTPAPVAASADGGPKVAGLCVVAKDTGRVFMLQRGLASADNPDPAGGTWEFPGGHLEGNESPYEGAKREWQEETGYPLPPATNDPEQANDLWNSSNGIYRGHVHVIPHEGDIDMHAREKGTNPDDPDGDTFEASAWWDPHALKGNPVVRPELQHNMPHVHSALDGWLPTDEPDDLEATGLAASSVHHLRRVREAKDSDALFDADRAATDLLEQDKRRTFETMIGSRHAALVGEGIDQSEAASTIRREIEAENSRRDLWEQQRADSLMAEKERRLRVHPDIRLSHEISKRAKDFDFGQTVMDTYDAAKANAPIAAAVAHTAMPGQLRDYWVAGAGAAKIRWNVRGDWARCRDHLVKYMDLYRAKAACNELHKLATGRWTGSKANKIAEP